MKKKLAKFYKQIEDATSFDINPSVGLTEEQVKTRIEEGLVNKPPKHVTKSYWKILSDNLINFFNILLFAIAAVMVVAQVEIKYFAFLIILIINIGIGLYQDIHARKLVDKLQVVTSPRVIVLRNGEEIEVSSKEVVLSDVLILKTGDQIIVDGELIEGSLEVNESLLTGESLDIKKEIGSKVLSGSFVTGGRAKIVVKTIGRGSYAERLQEQARSFKRPKSEIITSIKRVFKIIGFFVVALGTALIITYAVQGKFSFNPDGTVQGSSFQQAITSVSGSLVSMIPTGMYLLTSSTLAVGVIRLGRKRMLVQELYCIEMLARVDTLCLDKTGTITDGTMNVSDVITLGELTKNDIGDIVLSLTKGTGDTNSTSNAFLRAFENNKLLEVHSSIPFSSKRKYSAVLLKNGLTYAVGAREFVGLSDEKIIKKCEGFEAEGLRVLVLVSSAKPIDVEKPLSNLKPEAILVLEDNIKPDAITNIDWFKKNGVTTKIISGDNALSVSKIAAKVGVLDADKYVSLDGMPLDEVRKIANQYTVFGRVSPEQKEALVTAMREEGHVVAMTGDGVNDILALRSADCSIAMASGSQAAKNSAHLVSLDSNFSALPDVVAEGRRVINNLQRTCSLFLCKTFFAAFMTLLFTILGWIDSSYSFPYSTPNLYVWELLTIGMASFFLAFQPNNERLKNTFNQNILKNSVPGAAIQILVATILLIIHWNNRDFMDLETMITMTVMVFSFTSYIVLLTICFPFDIYRTVLSIGIFIMMILLFIIDKFAYMAATGKSFFDITYETINGSNWWIMLVVAVGTISIYLLAVNLIDIYMKKLEREGKIK